MASLEFESGGVVKAWKYEWSDIVSYIDDVGNNEITGAILPTPSNTRSGTIVTSFTWHHLAPMVKFTISSSGSTITIRATKVEDKYNGYPYSTYSPTLSFFYEKNGVKQLIGAFDQNSDGYNKYNGGSCSVTTSDLQSSKIYVNCSANTCYVYRGSNKDQYTLLGNLKLHTHVSTPPAPTITATTGKTITVSGGDKVYCNTNSDGWYSSAHKFTGLSQGTSYTFKCRNECSCGTNFDSGNTTGKTWGISGSCTESTANTLKFKATHTAGTGGTASDKTVTYELYDNNSYSGTAVATKTGNSGTAVSFTGLSANKTYYCKMYTTGMTDNSCTASGKTWNISGSCTASTGKTLKFKATHTAGTGGSAADTTITYKLYTTSDCSGTAVGTKTGNSGSDVEFTGLSQGTTYYCKAYTTGISDNSCVISGKTWDISGSCTASTGKTLKFKATHTAGTGGGTDTITYDLYTSSSYSGTPIATKTGNSNANVEFTGLSQGTTYYCKMYTTGTTDNSCTASGKTWNISGSATGNTTKTLSFKATHTAGTEGDATKTITYELYDNSSYSGTPIATKTGASGNEVKFTGLTPNTNYYCKVYTTGVSDNSCTISHKTKQAFTAGTDSGDVSAKTIRYKVTWTANGSTGIVCTYTCSSGARSTADTSGTWFVPTGLVPGNTYTLSYSIVDDEDNTATGSMTFTTKKASFEDTNVTSKIIEFSSISNYSADTMQQKLDTGSWYDVAQDTLHRHNNLTHNTSYTVYARIKGCFAYGSDGNATTTNDSEISKSVKTYLLSLVGEIYEEHQHSIKTLWQAKVNNVNRDSDALDNTLFTFTSMKTEAKKEAGYQSSEVTEGVDGNTSGNYQTDKKITSSNLTWYYCKYIITAEISDGYNKVSATVEAHTTFPHSWLFDGNKWHKVMPYIYSGSKYIPGPGFVYNNGFKEPNGE